LDLGERELRFGRGVVAVDRRRVPARVGSLGPEEGHSLGGEH
jgi:hypothetical protein